MHIWLNGETHQTDCYNLAELVDQLDLNGKRFAVECNQQIIPKSHLADYALQDQDQIEIIHAVGGG